MKNSYHKLFSKLPEAMPPKGLLEKILLSVERKQRRKAWIGFIISLFSFLAGLGLIVPVSMNLQAEMSRSGFFQFLSLIFSDFSNIVQSWQEFALSLLEYLPIFSIVSFLVILFVLLASLRALFMRRRLVFHGFHHISFSNL